MTAKTPQIVPYLYCDDVDEAIEFLIAAFDSRRECASIRRPAAFHAQVKLGDQIVMLGQGGVDKTYGTPATLGRVTSGVFVYLDEVDAHYAKAKKAGAKIVEPLADLEYGRSYTARRFAGAHVVFHVAAGGLISPRSRSYSNRTTSAPCLRSRRRTVKWPRAIA